MQVQSFNSLSKRVYVFGIKDSRGIADVIVKARGCFHISGTDLFARIVGDDDKGIAFPQALSDWLWNAKKRWSRKERLCLRAMATMYIKGEI